MILIKEKKVEIFLTIVFLIFVVILGKQLTKKEEDIYITNEIEEKIQTEEEIEKIKIHIAGQVRNVGIVELEKGSRIVDAIEKAGGITEIGDISNINLAYTLEDGQKVYIPSIEEVEKEKEENNEIKYLQTGEGLIAEDGEKKKGKININTATQAELEKITGVGAALAQRILQYRKENGKFKNIEELKNVSGIGEKKFETLREQITI